MEHIEPQHDVVIDTPRLHLRPVRADDLAAIHAMRRNPMVMQYMQVKQISSKTTTF